jgi:hypothetical protein
LVRVRLIESRPSLRARSLGLSRVSFGCRWGSYPHAQKCLIPGAVTIASAKVAGTPHPAEIRSVEYLQLDGLRRTTRMWPARPCGTTTGRRTTWATQDLEAARTGDRYLIGENRTLNGKRYPPVVGLDPRKSGCCHNQQRLVKVPAIMRALDPEVGDAVWAAIAPLGPAPDRTHPLGCHRPRASDRDCFNGWSGWPRDVRGRTQNG